jgi:Na+-translocating ferredoxin:NAD+ oxidoreductase RnfG subunit
VLALASFVGTAADAKVFYSREEAIELAFPGADRVEKRTFILTPEQTGRIEKRSRSPLETKLVTLYTGFKDGAIQGYAHIDVHTVRTKPEGFMVVLDAAGGVRSLRVLAFHEPQEYLPAERWYSQFEGKSSADPLRLGRDVHGVAGATLSARAATRSVRRVLAYYEVLIRPQSQAG